MPGKPVQAAALPYRRPAQFGRRKLPPATEHDEQVRVIEWARWHESKWPELALLHAIPNAGAGAQRGQAGKMKAEGVKPGVPDLCLPVRRKGYSGVYIEMKRVGGKLSPEQFTWLAALADQGFHACTAYGADQAINVLREYLTWPP